MLTADLSWKSTESLNYLFLLKKLKINVPLGVKSHQISLSAFVLGMYKAFL